MASLLITSENQIQRLNHMVSKVKELQALDVAELTSPPHSKSWNVVEVIEHLNIAYGIYMPKLDEVFSKIPALDAAPNEFKARTWQKIVIAGQRPKNGKRKWKMKTLKRFEPLLDNPLAQEKIDAVFETFFTRHAHLKEAILKSRNKDVTQVKMNSAIGPIVNFYLPECFEFLLCHLERHMVQIEEILG
ncbi:DinB family protein [Flagellimonas myxillae]|uniref:DinB family protein n=1 Tax=Flagellimonas myxillae TaxID=2942214 RepID=UPI00201E9B62|nr:DinB family protein [Muricauda myxillae]MCL6266514.1 DinB family protein [Muricauda myxillae]